MAFDPWGARRDLPAGKLSNKALTEASVLASFAKTQWRELVTNRGFTGHEMLDEVGIIHMNGRIYDATIARFLQADPNVDGVTRVSGFNRYAYGGNNPLNGTDPSGYGWLSKAWKKLKPFVGIIVGAVVAMYCTVCGGKIMTAAWAGAAAGAAGAAVNGGNILQGAVMGFVSGAAFGAVGEYFNGASAANLAKVASRAKKLSSFVKFGGNLLSSTQVAAQIAAHATVGGVVSVLQGGKFGHGFLSAGFTKGVMGGAGFDYSNADTSAIAGRTAVAALVGGTVSEATGGKFANGAKTAAMAHLLNAESGNWGGVVKKHISALFASSKLEISLGLQVGLKSKFPGILDAGGELGVSANATADGSGAENGYTFKAVGQLKLDVAKVLEFGGSEEFGFEMREGYKNNWYEKPDQFKLNIAPVHPISQEFKFGVKAILGIEYTLNVKQYYDLTKGN